MPTAFGAATPEERQEAHVRSLLEELDKCERAGRTERVAAIKAELGMRVAEAKPPARRAQKRPAVDRGQTR